MLIPITVGLGLLSLVEPSLEEAGSLEAGSLAAEEWLEEWLVR